MPGADRARVGEQPARGPAAAAAAAADAEGPQRERPGRAGPILHPDRRPRCQLVNHQKRGIIAQDFTKEKKKHHEKNLNFLKSRKKEQKEQKMLKTQAL